MGLESTGDHRSSLVDEGNSMMWLRALSVRARGP